MKNRFPLEVVLLIRRNAEAAQAMKLKAIKEKRLELLEQLDGTRAEIELLAARRPEQGTAFELASGQKYSELLYRRCALILNEIQKASAREAEQRKELMAALKERKKIEKLKESWAGKRAGELSKIETAEMDETARFQFAREAL